MGLIDPRGTEMVLAAGEGCWPRLLQARLLQLKPGSERSRALGDRDQAWAPHAPCTLVTAASPPDMWATQSSHLPAAERTVCGHSPQARVALHPPFLLHSRALGDRVAFPSSAPEPQTRRTWDDFTGGWVAVATGALSLKLCLNGTCWREAHPAAPSSTAARWGRRAGAQLSRVATSMQEVHSQAEVPPRAMGSPGRAKAIADLFL